MAIRYSEGNKKDWTYYEGKIKPRIAVKYDAILRDLKEKMQGYSHKDQKPYWQ